MQTTLQDGTIILDQFRVKEVLWEDSVYRWLMAEDTNNNGEIVKLQILVADCSQDIKEQLYGYFDALQQISRPGVVKPRQSLSDSNYPLVLVYERDDVVPGENGLSSNAGTDIGVWEQLCEILHQIKNKHLVHGQICPRNISMVDGEIFLTGFGYAPLLAAGNSIALKECADYVAPEVSDGIDLTGSADVYSLAKAVIHFIPTLADTEWYASLTNKDATKRPRRLRDIAKSLSLAMLPAENEVSGAVEDEGKEQSTRKSSASSGLVPMCNLTVQVEPVGSGAVACGDRYKLDSEIHVKAKPNSGWEFACWSGDVSGVDNPVTFSMSADKSITAHFVSTLPDTVPAAGVAATETPIKRRNHLKTFAALLALVFIVAVLYFSMIHRNQGMPLVKGGATNGSSTSGAGAKNGSGTSGGGATKGSNTGNDTSGGGATHGSNTGNGMSSGGATHGSNTGNGTSGGNATHGSNTGSGTSGGGATRHKQIGSGKSGGAPGTTGVDIPREKDSDGKVPATPPGEAGPNTITETKPNTY